MKITITIELDEKNLKMFDNEKVVNKDMGDNAEVSQYARFFDHSSPHWNANTGWNIKFLETQQQFANDLLRARGFLFLNEVYDMLGMSRTKDGQKVGWSYEDNNPIGDNFVDFSINSKINREQLDHGKYNVLLLDFNVDGDILHKLEKKLKKN